MTWSRTRSALSSGTTTTPASPPAPEPGPSGVSRHAAAVRATRRRHSSSTETTHQFGLEGDRGGGGRVARTESRQELLAGASMTRPNEAVLDAADGCGYPPSGGSTTAVFRTCAQFSSALKVAATPSA